MSEPATRNLTLRQGEDFEETFSVFIDDEVVNYTGYQFEGDCKAEQSQSSPVLFSFSFSLLEGGTVVQVNVDYEDFSTIPLGPTVDNQKSQFYYDYFATSPDGTREKIQKGRVAIEPAITELP